MFVLIKRKLEGPSIPELGQPTSVTFDSVTVPVARPSTGPAALASYELQRSLDGTTWSTIATGPSIFGNPAAQYVDGGRTALTRYYYRARATDAAGRVSDFCAPVSTTTLPNAVAAIMNTRFAGLSLPALADFSPGSKEYRLDGVDAQTGQVFSLGSPQIWGSQWDAPHLQLINNSAQNVSVDAAWLPTFTPDGLQIVRTIPYVGVPQAAYRLRPNAAFSQQTMVYVRGKFKLPAAMPTNADGGLSLVEVKYNYTDKKLQLDLYRDGGIWYLRCAVAGGEPGASPYLWGTGSTPNRTSTPTQDSFYTSPSGDISIFFKKGVFADDPAGAPPDFTRWYTYEFAFRLQSPSGVVAGGAASGWAWAATSLGTTTSPPTNGTGTQRFYIRGSNMFSEPSPGATLIFPFLHYTNFAVENLPLIWRQVELFDRWPDDASTHPADAI